MEFATHTPLLSAVKDAKSADGVIREEVAVPDALASDAEVKFQIAVRDSENKTADYNKDGAQKISLDQNETGAPPRSGVEMPIQNLGFAAVLELLNLSKSRLTLAPPSISYPYFAELI